MADERVHQRGLARTGGAADDGQQRRVERVEAGQHVVVDLVQGALALGAVLPRSDGLEGQLERGEVLAHAADGRVDTEVWGVLIRVWHVGHRLTGAHRPPIPPARRTETTEARSAGTGPPVTRVTPAGFEPALPP